MADDNKAVVWFLAGAAIGAAISLLYAPKSGSETRQTLAEAGKGLAEKGHVLYERGRKVADDAAELFERGKRLVGGEDRKDEPTESAAG